MAHINIYTGDLTRIEDDFCIPSGLFYTNRKAAQNYCNRMNEHRKEKGRDGDGWEYIVHKHHAFSF